MKPRVSFATHFWGSFLGYLLPLFLVSYFGERLVAWALALPVSAWVAMGIGVVAIGSGGWLWRRRRAAATAEVAETK